MSRPHKANGGGGLKCVGAEEFESQRGDVVKDVAGLSRGLDRGRGGQNMILVVCGCRSIVFSLGEGTVESAEVSFLRMRMDDDDVNRFSRRQARNRRFG